MYNKRQQKLNNKILKAANRKEIPQQLKYLKRNGNDYLKAKQRNLTKNRTIRGQQSQMYNLENTSSVNK